MNKTLLYLIIFLLLGGATYWMVTQSEKDEKTSQLGDDRKFKVENPEEIHKIFFGRQEGKQYHPRSQW